MHIWLNSVLRKGWRSEQLLFSWYLFFGFNVNKLSKAWGQDSFLHLNMRRRILKMFVSYIFNAAISLKRRFECVNWSLKLVNLIDCLYWRKRVEYLVSG